MKILVNATTLRSGGGVQKAVEFVRASVAHGRGHDYAYALSDVVARNLESVVDLRTLDALVVDTSPARPLGGRSARAALRALERRVRPDVVYSVFGPAYVRFAAPHLMGFAVPWVTHPNRHAWATLRHPVARVRFWAWCRYVAFWARPATQWVLETRVAADGLARVLGVEGGRFHVVPNACAESYHVAREAGGRPEPRMDKRDAGDFLLLVFTSWYPHKNLERIPAIAAAARRRDPRRRYRFFLTFDTSLPAWGRIRDDAKSLDVEDQVVNLGPVRVADGPGLYLAADALFLPTLLETYTATYPEAMCMRRPILTTDLPFARDICGDAAVYFPPDDVEAAAESVLRVATDAALRESLVARGDRIHAAAVAPREIHARIVDLLESTAGIPGGHAGHREPVH